MSTYSEIKRLTTKQLLKMKGVERVTMLTAYDAVTAHCLDEIGIEMLLVGDSMGNVVYGFENTLPVTMDMMLAHTAAVVRGSKRALVIADLPFMTYQASIEEALRNAGRCLQEAGAQAVKLEGASEYNCILIKRLVEVGIPVVGHIGLTPQAVHQMGGYYTHGKTETTRARILEEAKKLSEAGCFAIVLECIEPSLAQEITKTIKALTIGIGSSDVSDGEVLVINDLLGLTLGKSPSFVKPLVDLKTTIKAVGREYIESTKGKKETTLVDTCN
ncbi:MAG: 3-methyl-2-oxobutanoate hydroxymethyltransferase [Oligoflexia bacterium]|nr:3-methyl-2-oxobutanoate hydroxymethyltransferase [Oligoflexia bacterium]